MAQVSYLLQAGRQRDVWGDVSDLLGPDAGPVPWRGLQMLYLHLLKDPLNIEAFASQTEVEHDTVIKLVIQLLQLVQPLEAPGNGFSEEIQNLQTTTHVESHPHLPSVMQAQLSGLLLSILLILSLSDNVSLKQLLHNAEAEQLLLKLARNEAETRQSNVHPYLRHPVLEKECPGVLSKLVELYRLIPLALLCICEAAGVRDAFHEQMDNSTRNMRKHSQHYSMELHKQLTNEVAFLQRARAVAKVEPDAALAPVKHQDLANHVTGSIGKHLTKLQQAFQSAIAGYDKCHTGNCPLFFAPHQAEVQGITRNAAHNSSFVPSRTDSVRPATKKSAPKTTTPSACCQPRSAAWLAVVTFTAGVVVGAATCNIRESSHNP